VPYEYYQKRQQDLLDQINAISNDPINKAVPGRPLSNGASRSHGCTEDDLRRFYNNRKQIEKLMDELHENARMVARISKKNHVEKRKNMNKILENVAQQLGAQLTEYPITSVRRERLGQNQCMADAIITCKNSSKSWLKFSHCSMSKGLERH